MRPLYFRGDHRKAALFLLRQTPLGDAVPWATDSEGTLTIILSEDREASLSTGEHALLTFLASLAGAHPVFLYDLLGDLDEACTFAVVWALGVAAGRFEVMPPIEIPVRP